MNAFKIRGKYVIADVYNLSPYWYEIARKTTDNFQSNHFFLNNALCYCQKISTNTAVFNNYDKIQVVKNNICVLPFPMVFSNLDVDFTELREKRKAIVYEFVRYATIKFDKNQIYINSLTFRSV